MSTFVRDPSSGAIINTDDSNYQAILAARARLKEARDFDQQVKSLQNELADVKAILQQILNGKKYG